MDVLVAGDRLRWLFNPGVKKLIFFRSNVLFDEFSISPFNLDFLSKRKKLAVRKKIFHQ